MELTVYAIMIIGGILFLTGIIIMPKRRRFLNKGGNVVTTGDLKKRGNIGLYMAITGFILLIVSGILAHFVLHLW